MTTLLNVEDLRTYFRTDRGLVKAVDGVSFHVNEQEIIGVVGESGSGKSVTMLSVMQLVAVPPGEIKANKIDFDGQDLLGFNPKGPQMCAIRGAKIAMIFQEPMSSLNPVLTICRQMTEVLERHLGTSKRMARERSVELLKMVGIPDPESRIDSYPHQFSGGMCQRVMIAMALSCNPRMIIADEPTTALDVTTQAQLLELMTDTVSRLNTSLIIVTHNLGVVARYVQRIYVMYAGYIVESGLSKDIFSSPRHPYTIGLLKSVPRLGETRSRRKLVPIEGAPPDLIDMPPGCAFLPRCKYGTEKCRQSRPPHREVGQGHGVACYVDV